eukprot:m51a1_g11317 putative rna 3 -terminal phosphate cyclase (109) ;mRNA; f:106145-108247
MIVGEGVQNCAKPAEDVGREAAEQLLRDLDQGGCVDEYLQDQLIIFMALAHGRSRMRVGEISLHTSTAMAVVSRMTGAAFEVAEAPEGSRGGHVISCDGIGFVNKNIA